MAYKEPGVYLRLVTNPRFATGFQPSLIPMVLGSGAKILEKTAVITRSTEGYEDVLPHEAISVLLVGTTSRKATFFPNTEESGEVGDPDYQEAETNDYGHAEGSDVIVWEETSDNVPEPGDNYYVIYTHAVTEDQYEPRLVFSQQEVERYYGTDICHHEEGSPLNRLAIAANIMLESGANVVYVMQVPENESAGEATAVEYQQALDEKAMFLNDVWRMVPTEVDRDIYSAIDAHVEFASSYEERMERTAIYGTPYLENDPNDFTDVYDEVGTYAESKNFKRLTVIYPDKATKMLSDGNFYELDAPFLCAAYTGREAFHPVQRSKTRDQIRAFNTLIGVPMLRKQMNMLAEKGVMLMTQPHGEGTDIIVRHQLTTEMASPQTRENSIVMIGDHVSKYLRYVCEQYIGKYNITGETLSRIKATLDGALYNLKKKGIITEGAVTQMLQDEYNPDTLLVDIRIKPPYPCNYIEITLFLD